MSAPNISLRYDDPASKDKGAIPRGPHKPQSPEYSSTPTLSVSRSSSTSGINSASRSTDSDPTASPATRRRVKSRRDKATSSAVNNENCEDGAYASQAASPQDAGDSEPEDTQSEQTPLREDGSVDIQMCGDPEDDNRNERHGVGRLVRKVLGCIIFGSVIIAVLVVLYLVAHSYLYGDVPLNPMQGRIQNIMKGKSKKNSLKEIIGYKKPYL